MEDLDPSRIQPLLLLGAGASKEFGVPVMDSFLGELQDEIEKTVAGGFAVRRSMAVAEAVDLEEVMYLLETLASMEREDPAAVPFLKTVQTKYRKNLRGLPGISAVKKQANRTLERLREHIFETCVKYDRNAARAVYEPLLESLYSLCQPERIYIATTNYDRIIEDMWERGEDGPHEGDPVLDLQTGFHRPSYGTPQLDTDRGYTQLGEDEDCAIHLVKLHGSIGWRQYDPGTVEDTRAREYAEGDTVLAYPVRLDKSNTPPFADLFDEFDKALVDSNFIMIVGSSLRDVGIVKRLAEALRAGEKVAVVIDPEPETVRNKLPSSVRKYVIPREEYFGPNDFSPSSEDDWRDLISSVRDRWVEAKSD